MHSPDRDTFLDLAASGAPGDALVIPVYRELLADLETPVSAYLKLAEGASHTFLLESVEGGEQAASYSFVGAAPRAVHVFERVDDGGLRDPLTLVEQVCSRRLVTPPGAELPRFLGGTIGFLGYECARQWEQLPLPAGEGMPGVPDAVQLEVDTLLVFDRLRHRVIAIATALVGTTGDLDPDAAYDDAIARIDDLVERLAAPLPDLPTDVTGAPRSGGVIAPTSCNTEPDVYRANVDVAREHIAAGDIIQVVLSQRWSRPTPADPFDVYRALRMVNPSPYMYFLKLDDLHLIGASPELLVQVADGTVSTHPIAGTRPRGATPDEDAALERELLADPKERAEHVMLVDLGRNDIGRVAEPGSVSVPELMVIERFSHVMHISSHVTGRLKAGLTSADALRACFPAGTVSGAPKIRAMEIIAALEPDRRGPYAGAVGVCSYDGQLDAAITIRTIVMQDGVATVQAGAGIVADSQPDAEYEETRNKARALLRAIDVAERFSAGARHAEGVTR